LNMAEEMLSRLASDARIARDTDSKDWWLTGQAGGTLGMSETEKMIDHNEMLSQAYKAFHTNLFARAIVRNLAKFVLGKGPKVRAKDKNQKVQEHWNNFLILNKWSLREKEMVTRTFRDGEILMRKFPITNQSDPNAGLMKIRFLRANNIRNPSSEDMFNKDENVTYGIGTNPNDIEEPITYYYCDQEGNLKEKIPAKEIIHIKIFADSDVKRGMSFLLVAMPMITKYMDWIEDRIVLNRARSAIALIRTVDAGAGTVQSIRDAQQTEHTDADKYKQKALRRGTVLTASKGVSYQMLSPKIQAADVKDDGRAMLLAVAAGSGFPEMILTSDYSNANYGSTMVAQNPFVREIEDWQDTFEFYYTQFFKETIEGGIEYGSLPKGSSTECTIEWPPLILADIEKNNKAREIQHKNKILSKKTWQLKEALDPETEEKNMEEEQGKDIYKVPFNLPSAPTNQFGADFDEEEIEEEIEEDYYGDEE